jgi:hypothetical protein
MAPTQKAWRIDAVDSRLAAGVMACCLAAPGDAAQAPAPPVFRAEADLVTIDVQVTKRNGGALPPLARESFEGPDRRAETNAEVRRIPSRRRRCGDEGTDRATPRPHD